MKMNGTTFSTCPDEEIKIHWTEVQTIVNGFRKKVKGGLDKLRAEFLQQLCGNKTEPLPREHEFMDLLAQVLTLMANGKMPKEIIPIIRDCEMHAGPKKHSDDVRPIGIWISRQSS